MMKVDIIAVGRLRNGPLFDLSQDYQRRIQWSLNMIEVESKSTDPATAQRQEEEKILTHIDDRAFLCVLDERGNGLRSLDFAHTLQNLKDGGDNHIQFILGGADGLTDEVRGRANMLLSFGQQTWPHMLARIMLLEQIYRAQQILAGHPYHRE